MIGIASPSEAPALDSAVSHLFSSVVVHEPNPELLGRIMGSRQAELERHFCVAFPEAVLRGAAYAAGKLLPKLSMPSKARWPGLYFSERRSLPA